MLWITSSFFFQFPFCLLHLPYFSAFTPDTNPPGFVFLCSHFSAISISQPVFKVKLPAFFFFLFIFSRSLCSFFLFSSHSVFCSTTPPKSVLLFLLNLDWSWTFHSPSLFCSFPTSFCIISSQFLPSLVISFLCLLGMQDKLFTFRRRKQAASRLKSP